MTRKNVLGRFPSNGGISKNLRGSEYFGQHSRRVVERKRQLQTQDGKEPGSGRILKFLRAAMSIEGVNRCLLS